MSRPQFGVQISPDLLERYYPILASLTESFRLGGNDLAILTADEYAGLPQMPAWLTGDVRALLVHNPRVDRIPAENSFPTIYARPWSTHPGLALHDWPKFTPNLVEVTANFGPELDLTNAVADVLAALAVVAGNATVETVHEVPGAAIVRARLADAPVQISLVESTATFSSLQIVVHAFNTQLRVRVPASTVAEPAEGENQPVTIEPVSATYFEPDSGTEYPTIFEGSERASMRRAYELLANGGNADQPLQAFALP